MDLTAHFQLLARYNRIANERLYATCARLDYNGYRKRRAGSFGSIHAFESGQRVTPPLDQILYDDFSSLRTARVREDARIEAFFAHLDVAFWTRSFPYTNNEGKDYVETAHVACTHLFNHQTHHRGQIHVMLSQTTTKPPSLDLHRSVNP